MGEDCPHAHNPISVNFLLCDLYNDPVNGSNPSVSQGIDNRKDLYVIRINVREGVLKFIGLKTLSDNKKCQYSREMTQTT